jgi:NAD(P)H-dependent FMN reductase
MHLRQILAGLGVTVLGTQVTLPRAHEAFDETGALRSAETHEAVRRLAAALAQMAASLREAKAPGRMV